MIVKQVPALKEGQEFGYARARHVRHLVDYMNLPEKDSVLGDYLLRYMHAEGIPVRGVERLLHTGALNFVSEEMHGQRAEMMATAQAATRSPNPIDHWILSWRESVHPSREQLAETVAMFLDDLGLAGHQSIWAAHGDTHNIHVHIAVNRYDARTRQMVTVNRGFTHNAGHAAVARICDRFGWEPEARARFTVVEGLVQLSEDARQRQAEGTRPITRAAAAQEARSGHRSAQRIAQEDAWPIIRAALSWRDLHAALAKAGFRYDAVGTNGSCLTVHGTKVMASTIHRQATITAIERRLEEAFRARDPDIVLVPRDPGNDVLPHAFRADEYRRAAEHRRIEVRQHRERRWQAGEEIAAHRRAVQADLASVRALDWSGQAIERAVLLDAIGDAGREREAALKVAALTPFPRDYEAWLREQDEHWFAERVRRRRDPPEPDAVLVGPGTRTGATLPAEIDGYRAYRVQGGVRYARDGEGTAFVDLGDRIEVVPARGDDALLAALKLAAIRFDRKVSVKGTPAIREQVYRLAVTHGLADVLADPDMVARERHRILPAGQATASAHQPSSSEKHRAVRRPADDILIAAHRIFLALCQSHPRRRIGLGPPRSAAGLRGLSGLDVVPGPDPDEMLLRDDQRADVGRR